MLTISANKTTGPHILFTNRGRCSFLFPPLFFFFFFPRDIQLSNQLGFKCARFQRHQISYSRFLRCENMHYLSKSVYARMEGILRCLILCKELGYTAYIYQEYVTFRQST